MRKYLFVATILVSFQTSFSQYDYSKPIRKQIDSLKKVLPALKGTHKVDCLNHLVWKYFDGSLGSWQAEADSARPYAIQANKEAKRIGYKKGLGDSYVNLETIDCMMFGTYAQGQKRFDNTTFNSAQQNAKDAISIGEEIKDYRILGEAYFVRSWLLSETRNTGNRDQYLAANIGYATKAIEYYSKTDNKNRLRRCYAEYSYLAAEDNDFDAAINRLENAIQLSLEMGDKAQAAYYYRHILRINFSTGDFENGLEHNKKYVQLAESLPKDIKGYNGEYSNSLTIMAIMYNTAGDYGTAMDLLYKAFKHSPPEDLDGHDFGLAVLGESYRLAGKNDSALYYLAPFAKKTNWGAVVGQVNLSNLYLDLKEYDKALPIIESYKILGKRVNDVGSEGIALTLKANAYLGKKDYKAALEYATKGLPILKAAKRKMMIIRNYELLSKTFHALAQNDSAYYYLSQYTILKDSLLNRQLYFRLNTYKKEAEEERKTSQINLLNKDNQLKEQKIKQQATLRNGLIVGILLLFLLGVFVFRNLLLKRKNDKLQMQKDFELERIENEKKQAELHQKAIELEMQALRAQMNPHFIFNCLSSINRFIFKGDNKAASDYLTRFSRLIRMVLMHSQKKLIPLEDELEMLRLYLDLERLRFKDAFDYSITTTNIVDAGNIFIPPLLLQPFCENAVWHGLMHKESKGHLNVIISEVISEGEKALHCVIEDDGVGRQKAAEMKSKSAENEKSLGLQITTERLAFLNRENDFDTFYRIEDIVNGNNEVSGTRVQLKIRHKESIEELV